MQAKRRPGGFTAFAILAALFGLAMVRVMLSRDWTIPVPSIAFRGSAGLLGALALVVAEAVWRVRPWAFRASLAFALGFAASVLVVAMTGADDPVEGAMGATFVLVFCAMFIVPIVLYVRERSQTLFPPRRGRVPPSPLRP